MSATNDPLHPAPIVDPLGVTADAMARVGETLELASRHQDTESTRMGSSSTMFAMMIGVITGTYSSIFVGAPVLVDFAKDKPLGAAAEVKKKKVKAPAL